MLKPKFLNKNEFENLPIKSSIDRKKVSKLIRRTKSNYKHEFIAELASELNPVSFREVLNRSYFTDPDLLGHSSAETFSDAFESKPLEGLSQTSYLQIGVETLNRDLDSVRTVNNSLREYCERVAKFDSQIIRPISRMVDATGFSKIALMKLFQLEVVSFNISDEDHNLRSEIYQSGSVRKLGDILMVIDQSIQPRGRPFRTMLSYARHINFGNDYYIRYRTQLSDVFCPFPTSESQVAGFCQNLAGYSLADQFISLSGLYSLSRNNGWRVSSQIESLASGELLSIFSTRMEPHEETQFFDALFGGKYSDYDIYNASVANRDFQHTNIFRNSADKLIIPSASNSHVIQINASENKRLKEANLSNLSLPDPSASSVSHQYLTLPQLTLSTLLRFLDFRSKWPTEFRLDHNAIGNVIESGMPIHHFISDQEIEKFNIALDEMGDAMSILMLRFLPIARGYSEDADYLFLRALEDAVKASDFDSLVEFIDASSDKFPNFIVSLIRALNPRRLQKCYRCVANYQDTTSSHRKLLEIAAKITGDLDLVVQADQSAVDEKLASARAHFDNSRVFVDEVLFRNWAMEEVSPSLEAVRKHIFFYSPELPDNPTTEEIAASMKSGALNVIVNFLKEHFTNLPIRDAFKKFCLDHYFGIDSFLGRRIRHNATHGLLLGQLDKICANAIEKDPQVEIEIQTSYDSWRIEYLAEVDKLVNERFRFNTPEFPNGVLAPDFENVSSKMRDVENDLISQILVKSKPEIIVQNMIVGFWGVLDPELRKMRQYLRSDFTQITLDHIDRHFSNFPSPVMAVASDLKVALMERIERLASWYSPFSPADISISPSDLAQMVWSDGDDATGYRRLNVIGASADMQITGSNVRTLYDCLHVVIVNAAKHANGHSEVTLNFETTNSNDSGPKELSVSIMSSLSDSECKIEESSGKIEKIRAIVESTEISKEVMVVQGYSGIRKLKYLLYRTGRIETLEIVWVGGEIGIRFDIPVNFVERPTNDSAD